MHRRTVMLNGGSAVDSASRYLAGNGTVSLPAYSFKSDPTTGMYIRNGNTITFACAATNEFDVRFFYGPVTLTNFYSFDNGSGTPDLVLIRAASGVLQFSNNVSSDNTTQLGDSTHRLAGIFAGLATLNGLIINGGDIGLSASQGVIVSAVRVVAFGTAGISGYNGIATAGYGVSPIYAHGRFTAQVAAKASVAAYAIGAADGSFEVSANINVTAATTAAFTCTCTYTDEANVSRTLTFGFTQLSGATLLTSITNVTGTGPYESPVYHIRCKASTSITIATVGTFTSVTYNVEATISQLA